MSPFQQPLDPGPCDAALLAAARGGDVRALTRLIRRHEPYLRRVCMHLCQRSDEAEDVFQDTLLQIATNIGSFRGDAAFRTWIYAVARSQASRWRRRRKALVEHTLPSGEHLDRTLRSLSDQGEDLDEAIGHRELRGRLENALSELTATDRAVLLMRDAEGRTAPEVALALGLTIPAVKSRLHRARVTLRGRLHDAHREVAPLQRCA